MTKTPLNPPFSKPSARGAKQEAQDPLLPKGEEDKAKRYANFCIAKINAA
jgi:hypothetical protein